MSVPLPKRFCAVLVYMCMVIMLIATLLFLLLGCYLSSLAVPLWELISGVCILLGTYCFVTFFHILLIPKPRTDQESDKSTHHS